MVFIQSTLLGPYALITINVVVKTILTLFVIYVMSLQLKNIKEMCKKVYFAYFGVIIDDCEACKTPH